MFCLRLIVIPLIFTVAFLTTWDGCGVESGAAEASTFATAEELQEILDGWADALGGRERLAAAGPRYSRLGVKMFGLEGQVEDWLTPDGHHSYVLDLAGLFSLTLVRTPDDSWIKDQNGKVSQQAGKDLADEITSVYLETWSYLLPDRLPGRVEYLGPEEETGLYRMHLLPEGGTEITIYLDPETMLPARSEQPFHNSETLTAHYYDWREISGIQQAGRIEQTTGTPQNDIHVTLLEMEYGVTPAPDQFTRPVENADDVRFTGTSPSASRDIPLQLSGVHIFLKAKINDSDPLWFILDTGASITVIDSELARELGFVLEGEIMGGGAGEGKVAVNMIQDASFSLPGVEITGQTVATIAIVDILEDRLGRRIDGIFGYDFISRFVVEIDYENKLLHLHDRNGYRYNGQGEVVPIQIVGSQPYCDAVVTVPDQEPITGNFLVDTGAGLAVAFSRPFTSEHDLLSTLPKKIYTEGGYGIGGESKNYMGRITSLELGDLEFGKPISQFSLDEKGAGADAVSAGLIGGRILEQCTVIFDYERLRMILEPNERFGSPIQENLSGFNFTTGGRGDWHTFRVTDVVKGSPAAMAGLATGDIILAVNGQPATQLRKDDLTELFCESGTIVKLTVRRQDKTLPMKMKLKPQV